MTYSFNGTPSALNRHIRTVDTTNGYNTPHHDVIRIPTYPKASQVPHKRLGPPSSGMKQHATKVKSTILQHTQGLHGINTRDNTCTHTNKAVAAPTGGNINVSATVTATQTTISKY